MTKTSTREKGAVKAESLNVCCMGGKDMLTGRGKDARGHFEDRE